MADPVDRLEEKLTRWCFVKIEEAVNSEVSAEDKVTKIKKYLTVARIITVGREGNSLQELFDKLPPEQQEEIRTTYIR